MPLALRLAGELALPGLETAGAAAALRGVGACVQTGEHGKGCKGEAGKMHGESRSLNESC